jgi:hypothetical protein
MNGDENVTNSDESAIRVVTAKLPRSGLPIRIEVTGPDGGDGSDSGDEPDSGDGMTSVGVAGP